MTSEESFRIAISASLGRAPKAIAAGKLHRFATSERRGDLAGWCKLFDALRGGVFGCYRQGVSESWSAIASARMTPSERAGQARAVAEARREREAAQREAWARNADRNAQLWAACLQLTPGDPVDRYLKRRAIDAWPLPKCLRVHPALPYWQDGAELGTFPAMVAPLMAADGRMLALHRTYLDGSGRKADVPTVKKLTSAAGLLTGACIRLHSPRDGAIGVAEGIETALAASLASGVPTVAAYSAGALAGYFWPSGVRSLVIFADADEAGRQAGDKLLMRASAAGLRARVEAPSMEGSDWADVWAERARA